MTINPRKRRMRNEPSRITVSGSVAEVEVRLDGTVAIIDAADAPLVAGEKWHYVKGGVRRVRVPQIGLHRVVLGLTSDDPVRVDHKNGDVLDNRRSNLRLADAAQNGWNRPRPNRNNTSGIPGVSRNRRGWMAYIDVRRKRHHLGTFPTVEEAADARQAAATRLHGEWAHDSIHKSPSLGDPGSAT